MVLDLTLLRLSRYDITGKKSSKMSPMREKGGIYFQLVYKYVSRVPGSSYRFTQFSILGSVASLDQLFGFSWVQEHGQCRLKLFYLLCIVKYIDAKGLLSA